MYVELLMMTIQVAEAMLSTLRSQLNGKRMITFVYFYHKYLAMQSKSAFFSQIENKIYLQMISTHTHLSESPMNKPKK